ncbi:MAG: hypothetical protein JO064_08060 [Actinobacteria bacterium]|nr:hypothetical protein [Actinomycetota bacterium]
MSTRGILACIAGAAAAASLAAGTAAAAGTHMTSCPSAGISYFAGRVGYRVVGLDTQGVPCLRARSVAALLAKNLALGKPVTIAGSESYAETTATPCLGCAGRTEVTLQFASGQLVVTMAGRGPVAAPLVPSLPFPVPIPAPVTQTPSSPLVI